jgi:hypothetical protein
LFTNAGSINPANINTLVADVYIVNGNEQAVGEAAANIQDFVRNGGGLVIGAQAWYWASLGKPVLQHPCNLVLNTMGIYVSGVFESDRSDYTFTGTPPTQIGNPEVMFSCIKDSCTDNTGSNCYMADEDELTKSMERLNDAAAFVPLDLPFWTTMQQVGTRDRSCTLCMPKSRHMEREHTLT